ncbi:MAG: PQQ-dependent sugar dehydrogenase [Acidobacteriota bacterium]
MITRRIVATTCALLACATTPAAAQLRAQLVATGLSAPVQMLRDPLAPDITYVVEQGGLVKVLHNGVALAPFIDLRGAIAAGGERGLLGMAFDPDVGSGRVYFNFTNVSGHTVIARFRRAAGSPLRADPASRFDLRWPSGERFIRQPFANHNGGNLVFGPDGHLYIGLGDGGSGNDPQNHAQNPASLLGKMLRLDVRVDDADPIGYRIPSDNPFVDGQPIAALGEIWAFGLRNPWRYSFDDVGAGATGALVIGDVGQSAREEIDYEPSGAGGRNYGWRMREGSIATPGVAPSAPAFGPLTEPIFDYGRSVGQAVTGGYVYRGAALGALYHGRYFFADYVSSRVFSLGLAVQPSGDAVVTDVLEHTAELGGNLGGIASFGRDFQGELYLLTFSGRLVKIVPAGVSPPPVPIGLTASVNATTVVLSWAVPPGALVTGYQLEAGSAPGLANVAVLSVPGLQTSITVTGVPPGRYYVRVRSLVGAAVSASSNEVRVDVSAPPGCLDPPAPTQLLAIVSGSIVTLSWQLDGASGAERFQIDAGSVSGAANLATLTVDGALRSLSVQAPPGTYFVRVRSVSACGISAPSNEVIVVVAAPMTVGGG